MPLADAKEGAAWRPLLLESALRGAALERATEAAAALRSPRNIELAIELAALQSPLPSRWSPLGMSQGWAGLAVVCDYLDACLPGNRWDETAHEYLRMASVATPEIGPPASLFGGIAGLGFAVHLLSRSGTRYRRMRHTVDDWLCAALDAAQGHQMEAASGVPFGLFDLISGWTGVIAYLIERQDEPRLSHHLNALVERLVRLIVHCDGLPAWHTPADLCQDRAMASRYPGGVLNCGLAHGIPGPLTVLSLASLRGIKTDRLAEAIHKVVCWIVAHRIEDRWGTNWPEVVPLNTGDPRERSSGRASWCYGSPGIARALWIAGRATGEHTWCELAVEAMRAVFRRPPGVRGLRSPTFCHGLAGLLAISLRFANETGSPDLIEGVNHLGRELVELYDPTAPLGYRAEDLPGVRADRPGLLDGAAGVIITLLAASTGVQPIWDRFFLLS